MNRQIDIEEAIAAKPVSWGYARVSTDDQVAQAQEPELRAAGAERVVYETGSGVSRLLALEDLLARLRRGDSLVVVEISRLGRSTAAVLALVDDLRARGVRLVVTRLGVDTSTPAGILVLGVLASLAQYEREQLRERQAAGIAAAKARGKNLGPAFKLSVEQVRHAAELVRAGTSISTAATLMGVSQPTLSRALWRHCPDLTLPAPGSRPGHSRKRGRRLTSSGCP